MLCFCVKGYQIIITVTIANVFISIEKILYFMQQSLPTIGPIIKKFFVPIAKSIFASQQYFTIIDVSQKV